MESLGLVNPEYQLEYDLISLSEKYRLPFDPQHFQSLSQPSVQTVEFELDSLSHDSRIVFKLKARNLLDRNDVVATSVLDLLDEKLHLREGSFRLLMWLNDFVDEKNRYQSYGRFNCSFIGGRVEICWRFVEGKQVGRIVLVLVDKMILFFVFKRLCKVISQVNVG